MSSERYAVQNRDILSDISGWPYRYCSKISNPTPDVHVYGKLIFFFKKLLLSINLMLT